MKKKQNNRISRIEVDIQRILSELISFGIKDPRVSALASVSRVDLTRDLSYATVYISGGDSDTLKGLNSASGFLRKQLAGELTTFRIPELLFKSDESLEHLLRIDELLKSVSRSGPSTNTLAEIASILKTDESESIAVLPHIFPDGDAIGSCAALCLALKQMGKHPELVVAEKVAGNISFMLDGLDVRNMADEPDAEDIGYDLVISLDTSSIEQLRDRRNIFDSAGRTISIDHHGTNVGFADVVYVDVCASATGEIIYDLLIEMGVEITPDMAGCLYTAIISDTGTFKHLNTTAKTFRTAAALRDCGFDFQRINNFVHKNVPMRKARLLQEALSKLEILGSGRIAVSNAIGTDLAEDSGDFDGISDYILSLEGIEASAFARSLGGDEIKFSLRSKNDVDVSKIAESMGGGGHMRAAGFVTKIPYDEAVAKIIEMAEKQL